MPREIGRKEIPELKTIFKLVAKVGENVTLWNTSANLQRFDTAYDAMLAFIEFRKTMYLVRKEKLLESLTEDLNWNLNRVKFITYWNTQLKDPHKKKRADLEAEFSAVVDLKYIDRLLSLQISSLTMEKVEEASLSASLVKGEIVQLEGMSADDLFIRDLDTL
ncbi:DNA gyrase/topoisomerase IV, subunit A [compost metagenome]